jgi:hypothetical protein
MRRISTCWKEDDDTVDFVLVLAPEVVWIMLCDHDKVLCHLFWANLAVYRVGPLAQVVVLRLQGSMSLDLKPDQCVTSALNELSFT